MARRVHPRTVRRRVSRCVQSVRFGPQACFGRIRAWDTLIGSGRTCESSGRRRHLSKLSAFNCSYDTEVGLFVLEYKPTCLVVTGGG